jgi:hypothetical protein
MQTNETTIITLPSGITAKLKAWLTGREKRKLRSVFLRDVELTAGKDGESAINGVKGSAIEEAENVAIECVVEELEGKAEDILTRVLDLRSDDYDALIAAINEVTSDKRFLAK